jgi:hypothetical protein
MANVHFTLMNWPQKMENPSAPTKPPANSQQKETIDESRFIASTFCDANLSRFESSNTGAGRQFDLSAKLQMDQKPSNDRHVGAGKAPAGARDDPI